MIVLAKKRLICKAERRKMRHDRDQNLITFKPGDKVLVKTHNQSSAAADEIKKFFLLFHGPCTVEKVVHHNAYLITDDSTGRSLGIQNVINLIPYKTPISVLE